MANVPVAVTLPAPALEVEAGPVPSPRVRLPAVTVRSPPKVVRVVNDQPPPERLKVTLLNCEPPGSTVLPVKMELKVTVPPCAVKVAEFSQLPPTVRL